MTRLSPRFRPALTGLVLVGLALAAALFFQLGREARQPAMPVQFSGNAMGTQWRVSIAAELNSGDRQRTRRDIEAQLARADAHFSHWRRDSELSALNAAPAGQWLPISAAMESLLRLGVEVSEQTDGAFDMTVGESVNLWGFGPAGKADQPPARAKLGAAVRRGSWEKLQLQQGKANRTSEFVLDLSAIAKGRAVDWIAQRLSELGYADWLVEIGGEVKISGSKFGSPWTLGIARPDAPPGALALTLRQKSRGEEGNNSIAIATSGDYFRYFEKDGQRYSHLLNPRTGQPAGTADAGGEAVSHAASVSVADPLCARADALATALAVMPADEALAWAERHRVPVLLLLRPAADSSTPALGDDGPLLLRRASSQWDALFVGQTE